MVPDLEKPRIIEIQVRMDCNGCVQKIKKTLHGINGIYDIHIDFPQQKLIVIGWADPERIVKAIRKARKVIGSVCVHTDEASEPPPEGTEPPPPEGEQPPPPPEGEEPPPPNSESPPAEDTTQTEPPKDPPPPENPIPELLPSQIAMETMESQSMRHHSGPRDVEEIHVIHHHQHEYTGQTNNYPPENHLGYWSNYPRVHGYRTEPLVYSQGVRTEPPPPEPPVYTHANRPEPPVYTHSVRSEPHVYSHAVRSEPHVYSHAVRSEPPVYSHAIRPEPTVYSHSIRPEPPVYVTRSYNTYKPSPYISQYEYVQSPPQQSRFHRTEHYYREDYHNRDNSNGNNITSIFSDENPNACRIV